MHVENINEMNTVVKDTDVILSTVHTYIHINLKYIYIRYIHIQVILVKDVVACDYKHYNFYSMNNQLWNTKIHEFNQLIYHS